MLAKVSCSVLDCVVLYFIIHLWDVGLSSRNPNMKDANIIIDNDINGVPTQKRRGVASGKSGRSQASGRHPEKTWQQWNIKAQGMDIREATDKPRERSTWRHFVMASLSANVWRSGKLELEYGIILDAEVLNKCICRPVIANVRPQPCSFLNEMMGWHP